MEYIKEVFLRDDNKLGIVYLDDLYLWLDTNSNTFGFIVYRIRTSGPESMSAFSKEELLDYQYIILNAYMYSYDLLENGIEKNLSKKDLENYKSIVMILRKVLRKYTDYINQYDELLKEFKDV